MCERTSRPEKIFKKALLLFAPVQPVSSETNASGLFLFTKLEYKIRVQVEIIFGCPRFCTLFVILLGMVAGSAMQLHLDQMVCGMGPSSM